MAKRKRSKFSFSWIITLLAILLCAIGVVAIIRGVQEIGNWIEEYLYFPGEPDDSDDSEDSDDSNEFDELRYHRYVEAASEEFDVPQSVIYAVIYCESSFEADAVSSAGAKGLMQMMPATFKELQGYLKETHSDDELLDPQISIRYGTYYLSRLYKRFENWETVFAAYNAGPTIVSKWLKDAKYSSDGKTLSHIPYSETSYYVKKVSGMVEKYNEYQHTEVQK